MLEQRFRSVIRFFVSVELREMTDLLKRLGVVVPTAMRKFLKFIGPQNFLVSLTLNHTPLGHCDPSLMRAVLSP
jgi:hypothetical protein